MKVFFKLLFDKIKLNIQSFIVIGISILCLFTYYFINYRKSMYQIVLVLSLFIPVCFDLIKKLMYDNQNKNYFEIHNFSTVRLYLIFVMPLFILVNTNWSIFKNILEIKSLAYIVIYIICNVIVNSFVIKYQLNDKRNSELDQTINLVMYLLIGGLIILAY